MFSPVETVSHSTFQSQPVGRLSCYDYLVPQETPINRTARAYVEILEQPAAVSTRFRYRCEGRSAGCIRGVNSNNKHKTYPTIKVHGYQGAAEVIVSCVTKDGPPFYPHPHNLVGKTCTSGVCYKSINNPDMVCNFATIGIQCVKKKEIKESLSQREAIRVDPFGTGFSHYAEVNKINLNSVRLCFQVILPDENGKFCVPLQPVISNPIFDNKTVSDLKIRKLSHCSAPVTGGQEVILLCDQVNKDDIQVVFYEDYDNGDSWQAYGKFSPQHVHRKVAISFQTPPYKALNIRQPVECFIQLQRPSDGAVGEPRSFTFLPLQNDPEGLARKRSKFEALRLDCVLQPNNLPQVPAVDSSNLVAVPRLIKQAVRSKVICQSSSASLCQRQFSPVNNYPMHQSSVHGDISFVQNMDIPNGNQQKCNSPPVMMSNAQSCSRQKVEEILAIAKEQMGMNNPTEFNETPSDETLDKLSSLDLGIDPSELDVNLSGITLDSFSEPSGLNFSTPLMDSKNGIP